MTTGVRAPHGEKTIEIRIRFFTNELASGSGNIWPKHAWDRGSVYTVVNKAHGIDTEGATFNSLPQLIVAIEKVLIKAGIQLHHSGKAGSIYVR